MSDRPDDPDIPLAPFPTARPVSPFPALQEAVEPARDMPVEDPPAASIATVDAHDLPAAPEPASRGNPLLALGRFAFPPGEPPDDEGMAARDRRWASRIIVIATVFLLIFNAVSIQNWAGQQAPGWMTTTVRRVADVWAEQVGLLGAGQPRQAVREGYETARDADWVSVSSPRRSDGEAARSEAE